MLRAYAGRYVGGFTARLRHAPLRAAVIVVLFSALPFAEFLAVNASEALNVVSRLLAYPLLVAIPGFTAITIAHRRGGQLPAERVAVAYALAVWLFFHWSWFEDLFDVDTGASLLLFVSTIAAGSAAAGSLAKRRAVRDLAVVLGALLLAVSVAQYVVFVATDENALSAELRGPKPEVSVVEALAAVPRGKLPNVYYFVFDGYGRADQLREHLDLDIRPFLKRLRYRGFRVDDNAYASYPLTELSIGSVLTWNYPLIPSDEEFTDFNPLKSALFSVFAESNRTLKTFRDLGYRYVYGSDRRTLHCRDEVDVCIESEQPTFSRWIGESETVIIDRTPLRRVVSKLTDAANVQTGPEHIEPSDVLDALDQSPDNPPPLFMFLHILAPHHPWRYQGADCMLRRHLAPGVFAVVQEATEVFPGDPVDERTGYADNIACVNQSFLFTVDRIIERDPDAVIIAMGDHGSRYGFSAIEDPRVISPVLRETFAILYAARLPDRCEGIELPDSPAGTFPMIFSCLTGRRILAPPPRHFFLRARGEIELTEIPHEELVE